MHVRVCVCVSQLVFSGCGTSSILVLLLCQKGVVVLKHLHLVYCRILAGGTISVVLSH